MLRAKSRIPLLLDMQKASLSSHHSAFSAHLSVAVSPGIDRLDGHRRRREQSGHPHPSDRRPKMADALLRLLLLLLWFPTRHDAMPMPSNPSIRPSDGQTVVIFPSSRAGTLLDKTADIMEQHAISGPT